MKPDAIDIELLVAGAITDPAEASAINDQLDADGRALKTELEEARRAWKTRKRPPLSITPPANRPYTWRSIALAASLLMASAAALTLNDAPSVNGVRSMGALPVDYWVERDGEPASTPGPLFASDQLFLQINPTQSGYLSVATLQDDGQVFLLWQGAVQSKTPFSLDQAIQLDDHRGAEWLIVQEHRREQSAEALQAQLITLLPDPQQAEDAHRWALDIRRSR